MGKDEIDAVQRELIGAPLPRMTIAKKREFIISNSKYLDKTAKMQILKIVISTAGDCVTGIRRGTAGKTSHIDLTRCEDDVVSMIYEIVRAFITLIDSPFEPT